MTIVGDKSLFAIETTFHEEAERTLSRVYGRFRFWIGGIAYGKDDDDAACLVCHGMIARLHNRGTYLDHALATQSQMNVLYRVVHGVYETLPENFESVEAFQASAQHYCRMLMSNDGDEAFDDRSQIVHLDIGANVRLVAGRRTGDYLSDWRNPPTFDEWCAQTRWDPASLADVVLDADLFYQTIADWLAWFRAEVKI